MDILDLFEFNKTSQMHIEERDREFGKHNELLQVSEACITTTEALLTTVERGLIKDNQLLLSSRACISETKALLVKLEKIKEQQSKSYRTYPTNQHPEDTSL